MSHLRYLLRELQKRTRAIFTAFHGLAVILVIAPLLSACGKPVPETRSAVITFGCLSDQVTTYQALADEFHQVHPEIVVHVQQVDSLFNPFAPVSALPLATQTDTFIWYNLGLDQAARLGAMLDVAPMLEENSALKADFYPGALDAFRFGDGLWGLPAYTDALVMFYDRAIFDQLGVPYPQSGWNWQEFETTAERLTTREGRETVRYGFVDTTGGLFPLALIYQHGGRLFQQDPQSQLMMPALRDARAVEALDWYRALAIQYGVMPDWSDEESGDLSALVTEGRAAMWTGHLSSMATWSASGEASSIGVAPLPEDIAPAHPLISWGYAVSKGTANPQAAWRWIKYLTRQPGPPSTSQGWVPARQSLAEAEAYWTQLGEAAPAVRYALDHPLIEPGLWELWPVIRPITPLLRGEVSAEDFLAGAQRRADAWHAERMAVQPKPIAIVPPPQTAQAAQQTIVFGVLSAMQQAHYEALARAFMESHPNVRVEVRDVTAGSPVVERDRVAEMVDVFLWQSVEEYVNPDQPPILDLAPLIESDSGFATADYAPWLLAPASARQVWGLPIALDAEVVYYDKTIFDEAGVAYPSPDWSWDDLLVYGTQLAAGSKPDKQYGFLSSNSLPVDVYLYLESYNLHLAQQQGERVVYTFDSDEVRQAVQWWVDLDRKHGLMPPLMANAGARDYELVRAGRVAMWSDWASNRDAAWRYAPDRRIGILPIPRGEVTVAYINKWYAFISARTQQRETCWQWMRYLSDHLPPGYLAPARLSQINSSEFRQQVGDDLADAYLSAFEADSHLEFAAGPVLTWLEEALNKIAAGTDVSVALNEAQQKADLSAGQ